MTRRIRVRTYDAIPKEFENQTNHWRSISIDFEFGTRGAPKFRVGAATSIGPGNDWIHLDVFVFEPSPLFQKNL